MAIEIERKFLLKNNNWRNEVDHSYDVQQCYLGGDKFSTRVRIECDGEQAYITIKESKPGLSRMEVNADMCTSAARNIFDLVDKRVTKIRHIVYLPDTRYSDEESRWEIDVFTGLNDGLIIAEIELDAEDADFELPDWIGEEVTDNESYYNESLSVHPFCYWNVQRKRIVKCGNGL